MNEDQMNIPNLFKCPISLDLFQDPVTLCTGQTYDRSNIEKWLSAGNLTCPVTMQKLHDLSLVPNHTLQHLIHHWLCMDNKFHHEKNPILFDPNLSISVLKHNIESQNSSFPTRMEALQKIRILSQEWRRSYLVKQGFFPILLQILFKKQSLLQRENLEIAEQTLHCVLNLLPFSDIECLNILKESSHFGSFLVLLQQGNMKIKVNLCYLTGAIASSLKTKELCLLLGKSQCFWRGMISLLYNNNETSEAANKAISSLCSLKSNRDNFIKEGGVDGLLSYLLNSSSRRNQESVALATLEMLLESDKARDQLVCNPKGIHILVKFVFGVSFDQTASESAVSSLLNICSESVNVRDEAISAGVLTQLLLLLQSQCSSRGKNKARVLLKLLRSI
ncbi:hypothetical protein ACHQM5_022242 [Ranunculus cassubicifolius]